MGGCGHCGFNFAGAAKICQRSKQELNQQKEYRRRLRATSLGVGHGGHGINGSSGKEAGGGEGGNGNKLTDKPAEQNGESGGGDGK